MKGADKICSSIDGRDGWQEPGDGRALRPISTRRDQSIRGLILARVRSAYANDNLISGLLHSEEHDCITLNFSRKNMQRPVIHGLISVDFTIICLPVATALTRRAAFSLFQCHRHKRIHFLSDRRRRTCVVSRTMSAFPPPADEENKRKTNCAKWFLVIGGRFAK